MAGFNPVVAGVGDNKQESMGAIPIGMFTLTFTGTDTYLTGGMALTAALFGLSRPIAGIQVVGYNTAALGMEFFWNTQTQKLMARQSTTGAPAAFVEVANTTTIANFVLTLVIIGQR